MMSYLSGRFYCRCWNKTGVDKLLRNVLVQQCIQVSHSVLNECKIRLDGWILHI